MNTILSLIVVLLVLILIAAVFPKKKFIVRRELIINSSTWEVFNYIKFLKNHRAFSKWTTKDATKETEIRGVDGTIGFVQPWNNYKEKAGVGELEIKRIVEGEEIELEHRYFRPVRGLANTLIITEAAPPNQTKVIWEYRGFAKYPINLLTAMMNMDRIVGKDLEKCLINLRSALEAANSNSAGIDFPAKQLA